MQLLHPVSWPDYQLLDCGEEEKLERFGPYITIRPEPKATWSRSMPFAWWKEQAHWCFQPGAGKGIPGREDSGTWQQLKEVPFLWTLDYKGLFSMQVGPTSFKHVGIFPEQAPNWDYIYAKTAGRRALGIGPVPWVLNLFAYTGAASLAARAAGAEVVHVDAVRQVVTRGRENMEQSGLSGIRWVVEDALKFVKREERRGNKYHGIILDPPAYGYGPRGERWKLDNSLDVLLAGCSSILEQENAFLVLNLYALGYTAGTAERLIKTYFPGSKYSTFGELCLEDTFGKQLSVSVFARVEQ